MDTPPTYEAFKNLMAGLQSIVTAMALIIGGIWAIWRFRRQREAHPHVEFTADIIFVDEWRDWWIVELISHLENKGKVQHRIENFEFDLFGLYDEDPIQPSKQFGGQVYFPNLIARGSWLPERCDYFFIEPGVKAKYSFVARVPKRARTIILHSWFEYGDGKRSHTAERTVACPREGASMESQAAV